MASCECGGGGTSGVECGEWRGGKGGVWLDWRHYVYFLASLNALTGVGKRRVVTVTDQGAVNEIHTINNIRLEIIEILGIPEYDIVNSPFQTVLDSAS